MRTSSPAKRSGSIRPPVRIRDICSRNGSERSCASSSVGETTALTVDEGLRFIAVGTRGEVVAIDLHSGRGTRREVVGEDIWHAELGSQARE